MLFYTLLTKDTFKFSLNFGKDLVVVLFQLSCLFFCLVGNIVLIHFLLMGLKLEASVFFLFVSLVVVCFFLQITTNPSSSFSSCHAL